MRVNGGGSNDFLPFALPDISEEDIAEVVDTLRSGWITTGPKAKRFEQDFIDFLCQDKTESIAENHQALHAVAVNSATAGLHLALEGLGIGPGDEVITTTHTFTATAEVARYLGADVVLVDIDPDTLCIDPNAIESAITPRTKCILPVHYAGLAADMPKILDLANRHGLHVVEDAAHALPTTIDGQMIGTLSSDATVFSFYANKTMTTGEGGMLVTRNADLAQRARVMRLHGISRDAFDRFTAKTPSWRYDIIAPGFKYNMTDMAAALGLQQLKRARTFQQRRAEIARKYQQAFADLPVLLPPEPNNPTDCHAWHLYVLRLKGEGQVSNGGRDALIEQLFAQGIGCSVHYIPLHLHPYWRDRYHLTPAQFPHSQSAFERMLSLPIYSLMTDADVERVIAAVHLALKSE
jgi:dTDP-4-amino-4,6-dideoxygalactose transaminase